MGVFPLKLFKYIKIIIILPTMQSNLVTNFLRNLLNKRNNSSRHTLFEKVKTSTNSSFWTHFHLLYQILFFPLTLSSTLSNNPNMHCRTDHEVINFKYSSLKWPHFYNKGCGRRRRGSWLSYDSLKERWHWLGGRWCWGENVFTENVVQQFEKLVSIQTNKI